VTKSRFDSLQAFKKPFALDVSPITKLASVIKVRMAFSCDIQLVLDY
jgi:hypothetical protein